ncbi:MAG: hypothetical protein ABIS49_05045 [Aestuariivirga sp.]
MTTPSGAKVQWQWPRKPPKIAAVEIGAKSKHFRDAYDLTCFF